MAEDIFDIPLIDQAPIVNFVLQDQFAIPVQVDIDDFDLRFVLNNVELVSEVGANAAISMFVMDGFDQRSDFPSSYRSKNFILRMR